MFTTYSNGRSVEIGDDLSDVPELARLALFFGARAVEFYPNGFDSPDSCGCCSTHWRAGWYAKMCDESFRELNIESYYLHIVCDDNGDAVATVLGSGGSSVAACCD